MTTTRELPFTLNGQTFWVDCAAHGPVRPQTDSKELFGVTKEYIVGLTGMFRQYTALCSVCQVRGPVRITKGQRGKQTKCGRWCLDAKGADCACVCEGRDHGAGKCSCGKETP